MIQQHKSNLRALWRSNWNIEGLLAWPEHSIDGKVVGEFRKTLNSQATRVIIQNDDELNKAVYEAKIEQIEASAHLNFERIVSISITMFIW